MNIAMQNMDDLAVSQAMSAKPALSASTMAGIDKAANNFEGMFMTQMMQPMFESVSVDPTFGGGHGEEVMRSFMVQEFGKIAAKSGRIGIAPAIKNEMIRMQSANIAPQAFTSPLPTSSLPTAPVTAMPAQTSSSPANGV
jgi:Rod binding domain-containing protein